MRHEACNSLWVVSSVSCVCDRPRNFSHSYDWCVRLSVLGVCVSVYLLRSWLFMYWQHMDRWKMSMSRRTMRSTWSYLGLMLCQKPQLEYSIWRESATISWILDKAKATKINCEITLEMMSPESCCCSQVGHCPCPKNWVSFGTRSWALCARALAYWLPAESQLVEDLCRTRPLFVWAHRLHSALAPVVAVISSPHVEIRNRLWSATSDWACSWYEWFPTPFPF